MPGDDLGRWKVTIACRDAADAARPAEVLTRAGIDVTVVSVPIVAGLMLTILGSDCLVLCGGAVPVDDDLAIMRGLRQQEPRLPVLDLQTTELPARTALVLGLVDGILVEPTDDQLVRTVTRLAQASHDARRAARRPTVLAVGAHPDDVEIGVGVGGTLAAHARAGDTVAVLTMSRGARGGDAASRADEAAAAARVLGARLYLDDLVDTEMTAAGDTVRRIERVVPEVQPSIVYVHSEHDRHQDHRAVHAATVVATRSVPMLACYQSPSSTVEFQPNRFVEIDGVIDTKLRMLAAYASQARRGYMAPASVEVTARYWSRFGAGTLSEPLEVLRNNIVVGATGGVLATPSAWRSARGSEHDPDDRPEHEQD